MPSRIRWVMQAVIVTGVGKRDVCVQPAGACICERLQRLARCTKESSSNGTDGVCYLYDELFVFCNAPKGPHLTLLGWWVKPPLGRVSAFVIINASSRPSAQPLLQWQAECASILLWGPHGVRIQRARHTAHLVPGELSPPQTQTQTCW